MRRRFNSSTALVAGLSLIMPVAPLPAMAQETGASMICPDGSAQPCADGAQPIPAPTPTEAAPAEAAPAPQPEAQPEAAAPATEPAPEPAPAVEPAVVPEAVAPAAESAAVPAPAPEPTAVPEAAAPAPEPGAAPTAESAPAAEPTVVPEAAAPAAAEQPVTQDAPAAQPEVAPAAAAEAPAAPPPAVPDAAAPAAEAAAPAAVPAPDPAAVPATAVDPATTAESAAPVTAAPTAEELAKALAAEAAVPALPAETPVLPVQPDAATGEAPIAAAAAVTAPAAADGTAVPATAPAPADAVAQVTEETVTDATARSSSEDFANKVNQPAAAPAPATATAANPAPNPAPAAPAPVVVQQKKGLTDAEKLLLLGAGALVVGAIISNNRKVEMNSGDRVVVSRDGNYALIKDDDALLRQPGSKIRTETFNDGSTRTTVLRPDGTRIVTIRDAEMRVLRRVHVARDGYETLLIDDTVAYAPVDVARLPKPALRPVLTGATDTESLRAALAQESSAGRKFSLAQVRDIAEVRALVPVIDLDAITFETGSAAIRPDQAKALANLGALIQSYVRQSPREVFLIEGHTDAVGGAAYNLALSDRRAESVALALTEYFKVPPENMVVQGYGEEFLKVQSLGDERANRRASVRRITDLLQ